MKQKASCYHPCWPILILLLLFLWLTFVTLFLWLKTSVSWEITWDIPSSALCLVRSERISGVLVIILLSLWFTFSADLHLWWLVVCVLTSFLDPLTGVLSGEPDTFLLRALARGINTGIFFLSLQDETTWLTTGLWGLLPGIQSKLNSFKKASHSLVNILTKVPFSKVSHESSGDWF